MPLYIRDIDHDRAERFVRAIEFRSEDLEPKEGHWTVSRVVITDAAADVLAEVRDDMANYTADAREARADSFGPFDVDPEQEELLLFDERGGWIDPAVGFRAAVARILAEAIYRAHLGGDYATAGPAGRVIDVMQDVAGALSIIDSDEHRQQARRARLSA